MHLRARWIERQDGPEFLMVTPLDGCRSRSAVEPGV
jgi:hypothetical protein